MKFKITIIGLLTAILAVCLFTSYTLIDKVNKQFEHQKLQTKIGIETFEFENFNPLLEVSNQIWYSSYYYEWYDEYNQICEEE